MTKLKKNKFGVHSEIVPICQVSKPVLKDHWRKGNEVILLLILSYILMVFWNISHMLELHRDLYQINTKQKDRFCSKYFTSVLYWIYVKITQFRITPQKHMHLFVMVVAQQTAHFLLFVTCIIFVLNGFPKQQLFSFEILVQI